MSNKELLQEWQESVEYFKENDWDWNEYFYILELQKELKKRGLKVKET